MSKNLYQAYRNINIYQKPLGDEDYHLHVHSLVKSKSSAGWMGGGRWSFGLCLELQIFLIIVHIKIVTVICLIRCKI